MPTYRAYALCWTVASPRVSVVIPTFNRAEMVRNTIDSVLAQTVACEIVVSDHGSTDQTPSVMRGYGDRIRYVRREADSGPVFAWLDGVLQATGEFVHINYDDDWIDPRFVERTLALMSDGCGFVMTDVMRHGGNGTDSRLYPNLFSEGLNPSRLAEEYLLRHPLPISPGCALFRREDVLDSLYVGRIPFSLARYHGAGPDLFMFLVAMLRHPRFGFVDEPLAHFRAHEGSITIDAMADPLRSKDLTSAYNAVKRYYLVLKWAELTRLPSLVWRLTRLGMRVRRRVLRILGRR